MSCNICFENYNKSNHNKICCPYCEFDSCRTCCETYILLETISKCMKPECAKEWSRKFLRENFTSVFLNSKYKEHLENILFDQEKALLPATQLVIQERFIKKKMLKELKELDDIIIPLLKQRRDLDYKIKNNIYVKETETQFVRQCPANDCRGFLSTRWKCGICEQWTCSKCHELKGTTSESEHTCDPNNVETATLLKKDTKPCPKCQSFIFKISGCDQMWCTQCHTGFSWATNKIEKNVHNPHYYVWLRQNNGVNAPRNITDVECGRQLSNQQTVLLYTVAKKHKDLYDTYWSNTILHFVSIIRQVIHNNQVELPKYQIDYVGNNQHLRIFYLENSITEEEFKTSIQKNYKKNKKNMEIAQVFQLVNTTVTDIVYKIIDNLDKSLNGEHIVPLFEKEFEGIIRYCNDILKDISFTYNCVQYKFNNIFKLCRA